MSVSESLARASTRGTVRPAFFLRIGLSPRPLRAFSGIGRRFLPADAVETTPGAPYLGCGFLNSVPELEALFGGESQEISLKLSGVNARALALVDQEAASVEGAPAHFGYGFLGSRWGLATAVYWDFDGEVQTVEWADEPGSGEGPHRSRHVAVNLVGGFSDRRFRMLQTVAPVDQALRDPTDLAFQHIPNLEQGATADWPLK